MLSLAFLTLCLPKYNSEYLFLFLRFLRQDQREFNLGLIFSYYWVKTLEYSTEGWLKRFHIPIRGKKLYLVPCVLWRLFTLIFWVLFPEVRSFLIHIWWSMLSWRYKDNPLQISGILFLCSFISLELWPMKSSLLSLSRHPFSHSLSEKTRFLGICLTAG